MFQREYRSSRYIQISRYIYNIPNNNNNNSNNNNTNNNNNNNNNKYTNYVHVLG